MNVCWIRRGPLEVRELEMGDEEAVRRSECVPGMRARNVVEAEWGRLRSGREGKRHDDDEKGSKNGKRIRRWSRKNG